MLTACTSQDASKDRAAYGDERITESNDHTMSTGAFAWMIMSE
jgi:hypothetical protein